MKCNNHRIPTSLSKKQLLLFIKTALDKKIQSNCKILLMNLSQETANPSPTFCDNIDMALDRIVSTPYFDL